MITEVPGVSLGHATDIEAATGCTVLLFDRPAMAAMDVGGGAASTRQTESLRPGGRVNEIHGILLTGGSAYGLAAADGCMRFLEERGIGFQATVARVPSVPTAVLFDLGVGSAARRPDAAMGYEACVRAAKGRVEEGNVGAGTGCSVAKRGGQASAYKGGIGSSSCRVGAYTVGAVAAVNALGDIWDPFANVAIARARGVEEGTWPRPPREAPPPDDVAPAGENTTLVALCTDAPFDRPQLGHLARMAHDGLALAIRPAHTPFDGDVVFAASTAKRTAPRADDLLLTTVAEAAIRVVADAIVRGVRAATPLHGLPAAGAGA